MTEPFIKCAGVTKAFGSTIAVDHTDLQLDRGTILALLGPSGCGKTTLLRLIAGFERVDEGTIELGGRLLSSPRNSLPPEKRRVGLVFQDYALFPHLNVEANVAFGVPRGVDKKARIAEMLELVGLDRLGKRMPHELSGGQQQRVALARTLAAEPDLVLLDEPFSNLDPSLRTRVRNDVWRILRECNQTAIVVTHDQEEAFGLPGLVGVMLDGRILQVGTAPELYLRPADRRVAEFIGDANFIRGDKQGSAAACALGTIPVTGEREGAVDLMVRPEDIRLDPDAPLQAEVVRTEYYGHDQVVFLRLPDGEIVRVRVLQGASYAPGEVYGLRLAGEAIAYPVEA